MKVLCEINNILELDDSSTVERLKKYIRLSDGQLNIEKNKEYCVYGILFRDNSPWFYLCLDEDDEYPTPYPTELFNIVDGRQSSFWRLSYASYPNGVVTSSIVFDEWSKDTSFYERLLDDDPEAIKLFRKYRSLMDKE
ncbi:hypothetical protein HB761_01275 [Vibrio campbellii]|uniref:Uncharacterized protein n=1 Tax=Vibrio campbellii TaxID=680 RepID=A0AAE9SKT1_9VIBR|nr:hypothetical protein [Vibrio campbellii]UTZ25492.1 hypothetical protein HB761_01275 [Vibrio campbellii]